MRSVLTPRVLFINKYYRPDNAATAQMLSDLAEFLAGHGFAVTVLTGRSGYRRSGGRLRCRETLNGVRVIRVASAGFGRHRTVGRLLDYVTFFFSAMVAAFGLPRQDVVVAMTSPPMIHVLGGVLHRIRRWRLALWTMDVYPDVAAALGVLSRTSCLFRCLADINRRVLRSADVVIAIGSRMAERLARAGTRAEALHTVHNWADGRHIVPVPPDENPFRLEQGLGQRFVVEYSGNVGLGHAFDAMLEGARRFNSDSEIAFLFIGGGPAMQRVLAYERRHALHNLVRLPWQPRERLALTLSAGDVHVVTLKQGLEGLLVPSKIYGIMAAGRPVIFVGPEACDTARVIRKAACGFVISNGDADGFVECVERLRAEPALRARLGRNARRFFEANFDRPAACARIERILRGSLRAGLRDGGR